MLWALALFAPFSLIASDLPRGWAWPLAAMACACAIVDARRHARQTVRQFVIPAGRGDATCDRDRIDGLEVAWRGPLAFLSWRGEDGVMRRLSFWPDTLDGVMRRELKLALQRREAANDSLSMAG